MQLHKNIKETRIQEICDKYIGKSVKDNKPISEKDVASLSCAELVVLYYNTEWLIERLNGDSVDTGLENQILLMDLINERVKTSTLYVIHTDATNLPFLTENKSILVYTEKRFADMVACSFNVEYFKESIRFVALEVSENKENYWNKLRAAGISTISVDGTKFTVEIDDLVENKENYENTEFCRFLIQYAQAIRLGIHRDKTSIFQEAILSKLKENPKMIHGSIISKGKNKFIPIYVNASAINKIVNISKLETENFYAICKEIFDDINITGIVLNPEREQIVVPREKILEDFAHCSKCGKLWQVEKLDSHGVCLVCLKQPYLTVTGTQILNTENRANLNRPAINRAQTVRQEKKQSNKALWRFVSSHIPINSIEPSISIPMGVEAIRQAKRAKTVRQEKKQSSNALWCLILSLIPMACIAPCISISMGIEAIRQAKRAQEAVSRKIWIGLGISVARILSFIIFMLSPTV